MSSDTLNEDEFADRPVQYSYIVTGPDGWTNEFSLETVELLLRVGAIKETHTTSAAGWQTTFYDTVGRYPA